MKPILYKDIKFNSNWKYENMETGCYYKSGIIPDKVFYSAIGGVIKYSDVKKIDKILEQAYLESNFQNKEYIRILDFSDLDKMSFKGRQHYINTVKHLNLKYKSKSTVTYICTANHWLKATLIFAEKFLNKKFIWVSNIDSALESISKSSTLLNFAENEQIETDETITIRKEEIDKILQFTSSVVWNSPEDQLEDYAILDKGPLSELFHSIKIMVTDTKDKLDREKIISEERNKSYLQQKLLTDISSLFNSTDEFENSINNAIRLAGEFTKVSRVYIFENYKDGEFTKNTYEWCNENIQSHLDNLQNIQYSSVPSFKKILNTKGIIISENISELPQDLKEALEPQGIKSIVTFPIYIKNKFFGFIGFDECERNRKWDSSEVELLKTIANIISTVFEHRKTENELKKSERFLRKMADNYPNSYISVIKKDFTISFASGQSFKKLNIAPESYIGLSLEEVFLDKAAFVKEQYARTFNGEEISFELFINSKYQQHRVIPFYADDGSISRIFAVVEDITEQKKVEQEIKKFRIISDAALHGNAVIDIKGNIIYINDYFANIHGYSTEELIGKNYSIFYSEKQISKVQSIIKSLVVDGKFEASEVYHIHKNGKEFPMLMNSVLIKNEFGEPQFIATSAIDITKLKETEETLRESEEKFRVLFEKSDDAILVIDDGKFVDCNQSVVNMLGYNSKEELLNTHPSQLSPEKQPDGESSFEKANEMMRIALAEGSNHFEWVHKRASGKEFPAEIWLTAIPYNGRKLIHTVWRDISEQKERELEIEKYQNNLEVLVNKRTEELIKYQEKLEDMVEDRTLQFQLSEEKHRALLDNSSDAIMRFDKKLRHLYVSPSILELTGMNPEKFIGKTHEELGFPSDLNEFWHNAILEVFNSKNKNRVEFQLPNGKWIDWTLAPEFNMEGEVETVLTSARDITENHLIRTKLNENMERYRVLFNSGSDAIFVNQYLPNNKVGKFIEVNDVACKMLGYKREELLEMLPEETSPIDSEEYQQILKELNKYKHIIFESVLIKKDGSKIDVEINSHLFMLNNALTILCIARNITWRKQNEELLLRKTKELEMFNETMLNREMRVIELKEEVNKLAEKLKEKPPYPPIWNKDRESDVE